MSMKQKYLKYKKKYIYLVNNLNKTGGGDDDGLVEIIEHKKFKKIVEEVSGTKDEIETLKCSEKLKKHLKKLYSLSMDLKKQFEMMNINDEKTNFTNRFKEYTAVKFFSHEGVFGQNDYEISPSKLNTFKSAYKIDKDYRIGEFNNKCTFKHIPESCIEESRDKVLELLEGNVGVYVTVTNKLCEDYTMCFKDKIPYQVIIEKNNNFYDAFIKLVNKLVKLSKESAEWTTFQKFKFCMKILDINVLLGKYMNLMTTINIFDIVDYNTWKKGMTCDNSRCLTKNIFFGSKPKEESLGVTILQCGVASPHNGQDYCFWCLQGMDYTMVKSQIHAMLPETDDNAKAFNENENTSRTYVKTKYKIIFEGDELNNCRVYLGDDYKSACRCVLEKMDDLKKIGNKPKNEIILEIENKKIKWDHLKKFSIKNKILDSKRNINDFII